MRQAVCQNITLQDLFPDHPQLNPTGEAFALIKHDLKRQKTSQPTDVAQGVERAVLVVQVRENFIPSIDGFKKHIEVKNSHFSE